MIGNMALLFRFIVSLNLLFFGLLGAMGAQAGSLTIPISNASGEVVDEVTLYNQSYALVIGIDNYTRGWPKLKNAVKDARAVAKAMTSKGFDVTLLVNPNRSELDIAIQEFFILKGENPDARLFLWFAGHGHTENDEGFIIPADGLTPEAGGRFRLSALPLRNINTYVRLAQSKHVYAVFDSCFAGTIFDSQRAAPPPVITKAVSKPVRQFLTSGDAYQSVSDDGSFRELFIRAITGDERADLNGDGFLAASELGLYLSDRVTNLTEGRQTPQFGKLRDKDFDRGDFIFALPQDGTLRTQITTSSATQSGQRQVELAYWNTIKNSPDPRAYTEYITQFPKGIFVSIAQRRLEGLVQESNETKSQEVAALSRSTLRPTRPEKNANAASGACEATEAARQQPINDMLTAIINLDAKDYVAQFMVDKAGSGDGLSPAKHQALRKKLAKQFKVIDEMGVSETEFLVVSQKDAETQFRVSYKERYKKKGKFWTRYTNEEKIIVKCDPETGRWMIIKITN